MKIVDEFLAHAQEAFPKEACGVVLQIGKKTRVVRCRNIHDEPDVAFTIHPDDYAAAEDQGDVIAIYHSHPNNCADPSPADLTMCEALGLPWHIVSWPQAGYRYIEPSGYVAPLEGRPFVYGIHDCATLVRDYYQQQLGIDVPVAPSEYGWWVRGENIYLDNLESSGFVRVEDLQVHDVILMQFDGSVPHHAAIFLGDDTLLHHFDGRLSGKAFYGEYYRKVTYCFARHKSLC